MSGTIVWFRNDLRLEDNAALRAAVEREHPVVPVFVDDSVKNDVWAPGAASRWWLHRSLISLNRDLQNLGSQLVILRGDPAEQLQRLTQDYAADSVYWNRRYEPELIFQDERVKMRLEEPGVEVRSFPGNLLFEPTDICTQQGNPYQVFTPFWKACLAYREPDEPTAGPVAIPAPQEWPDSLSVGELGLNPRIDWDAGLQEAWEPGFDGAQRRLEVFLQEAIAGYQAGRDRPDLQGTSRLSPHLHFGEISPRQIWHAVQRECRTDRRTTEGQSVERFSAELGWREFAHHVLFHFPKTPDQPLRSQFSRFPWVEDEAALKAWQTGSTGYPIVDAGMRELWSTGWMHNRVRMIVGSFLTKDLLISWRAGARWFWDTLVDADLANNTLGWQWISGCGADAAPYFRIFNPVSQGQKFDPDGAYVRRWVPELEAVPSRWIHEPWNAPAGELNAAGVELGIDYPEPIVDHAEARRAALAALEATKGD